MRGKGLLALVVAFVVTVAAAQAKERESWLLLEQAEKAELQNGTLKLTGIDDKIVIFSDRPYRDVRSIPVSELVSVWNKGKDSLKANPPNAALTGLRGGEQVGLVVILSDPVVTPDGLIFKYRIVKGADGTPLTDATVVIDYLHYMF